MMLVKIPVAPIPSSLSRSLVILRFQFHHFYPVLKNTEEEGK